MERQSPAHRSRSQRRASLPPHLHPHAGDHGQLGQAYQAVSGFPDTASLSLMPNAYSHFTGFLGPPRNGPTPLGSSTEPYIASHPVVSHDDVANIPRQLEQIRSRFQGEPRLDEPDVYGVAPTVGRLATYPDATLNQFGQTTLDSFCNPISGGLNGVDATENLIPSSQVDLAYLTSEPYHQPFDFSVELAPDLNTIPPSLQSGISSLGGSIKNNHNHHIPEAHTRYGTFASDLNPRISAIANELPPSTGSALETHLLQIVEEQYRTINLLLRQRASKCSAPPAAPPHHPIQSGAGTIPSARLVNNNHQNEIRPNRRQRNTQMTQTTSTGAVARKAFTRSAYDLVSRLQTSETRDHAACIRCQRSKKRCKMGADPSAPCVDCSNLNPSWLRIPCIRSHITDSILFRTATTDNDTWTTRPEIYALTGLTTYVSAELKQVALTHGFPSAGTLHVSVQSFNPVDGDVTSYSWTDKQGQPQEMEMPHFALSRLEAAKEAIIDFINAPVNINAYLVAHLDGSDPLITNIFRLAWRRVSKNNNQNGLLTQCLRLWMASRLIETPWRICGPETLGMNVIDDPNNMFFGKIPVTPVMDTQLDQIVIKTILVSLRRDVLKQLQDRILKKNPATWFDVFAAVFILLNNIEIAISHDHEFATSFGHVTPGRGSRFEDYNLIDGYFHSAQGIIAHFRYAFHGQIPFSKPCTVEQIAQYAVVDDTEANFLTRVKDHVVAREPYYKHLISCHKYEKQMYWAHQLLYEWWDPSQVHIREIGEEVAVAC